MPMSDQRFEAIIALIFLSLVVLTFAAVILTLNLTGHWPAR